MEPPTGITSESVCEMRVLTWELVRRVRSNLARTPTPELSRTIRNLEGILKALYTPSILTSEVLDSGFQLLVYGDVDAKQFERDKPVITSKEGIQDIITLATQELTFRSI